MAVQQCVACQAPARDAARFCLQCGQALVLQERYHLEGVLGRGGFAVVYAAWDSRLTRRCAIKQVPTTSPAERAQVESEIAILSTYASKFPFMPDIYDTWSDHAQTYMVMEYVDGQPLDDLLARPWPADEVQTFVRTLLEYLAGLHAKGIVHRDLKPANIKRSADGRYVLLDFGIAKQGGVTLMGARAASLDYAPPEQILGRPTDRRSDLYSLAATAYHLLTGQPPVPAHTRIATKERVKAPGALVPGVPAALEAALLQMLELDPAARPRDAQAALTLLRRPAAVVNAAPPAAPLLQPTPLPAAGAGAWQASLDTLACATCGQLHQPGDLFCDCCGQVLASDRLPASQPQWRQAAPPPPSAQAWSAGPPAIALAPPVAPPQPTAPPGERHILVARRRGGGFLPNALRFLLFGIPLGLFWTLVAWVCALTILGLPLSKKILYWVPRIVTRRTITIVQPAVGRLPAAAHFQRRRSLLLRLVYFVCLGWWLSLAWLILGWALLVLTPRAIPLAYRIFDRTPAVIALARTGTA